MINNEHRYDPVVSVLGGRPDPTEGNPLADPDRPQNVIERARRLRGFVDAARSVADAYPAEQQHVDRLIEHAQRWLSVPGRHSWVSCSCGGTFVPDLTSDIGVREHDSDDGGDAGEARINTVCNGKNCPRRGFAHFLVNPAEYVLIFGHPMAAEVSVEGHA